MNRVYFDDKCVVCYSGINFLRKKNPKCKIEFLEISKLNNPSPYSKAIIGELIVKCLSGQTISTTKGEQTREFNFVLNLVDGFIKVIENPNDSIGRVINIGCGEEVKIRDLVQMIHSLTNSKSELKIGIRTT